MLRLILPCLAVLVMAGSCSSEPDVPVASEPTKRPAQAPKLAVADLTIEVGSAAATLRWSYLNPGDCDQNREVNGADIAPIAAHFRKTSAAPDWATARMADADGNGEINAADIAPISANMGRRVDRCNVESAPAADGPWDLYATVEFTVSEVPEGGGPRQFSFALDGSGAGQWFRVLAVGREIVGPPSAAVQYPEPDLAPFVFSVSPLEVETGTAAIFSAQLGGGAPLGYAWNFGGGCAPNTSAAAAPQVTAGAPGDYNASLTVTNNAGTDQFDFVLTISDQPDPGVANQRETGPLHTVLRILPSDPIIRRDNRYSIDIGGGTAEPLDPGGYEDVLRTNGAQFTVEVVAGEAFPRLVAVSGTDPTAISFDTVGEPVLIQERSPGGVAFDTSGLAPGQYAFRMFNSGGSVIGGDTFEVHATPLPEFPLQGTNWGINVVNRTTADLQNLAFSGKTVKTSRCGGAQPDVLWLKARGRAGFGPTAWDVIIEHEFAGLFPTFTRKPRLVAQLDGQGTLLLIYAFAATDLEVNGGGLSEGEKYRIKLDDPSTAGVDHTSVQLLQVIP